RVRATQANHSDKVPDGSDARQDESPSFHQLSRMFNLIASGVVLLDSEGRVQFANVAAQKLLDDCVCPSFLNLLREDGAQTRQGSSAVIRAAIEAGLDGQEYTEFLSLARVDN